MIICNKTSEPRPPTTMRSSGADPSSPHFREELAYFAAHSKWLSTYTGPTDSALEELHRMYIRLPPSVVLFLWKYVRKYHSGHIDFWKKLHDELSSHHDQFHREIYGTVAQMQDDMRTLEAMSLPTIPLDHSGNPFTDLPQPL